MDNKIETYKIERRDSCTYISINDFKKYIETKFIEVLGANKIDYKTFKRNGNLIFDIIEEAIQKFRIVYDDE